MTSYGSTTAASDVEGRLKLDDLDTIEAEIDTMKAEVQTMRAAHSQQTAVADQKSQRIRAEATRIPAPVSSYTGTKTSSLSEQSTKEEKTEYPASSIPTMRSYAQGGPSMLKGPAYRSPPAQPATSTSSPVSGVSDSAEGASSSGSRSDTQQKYYDAAEYQHETTANPEPEKPSPHFALPTQATERRVGATLRKDSSPAKSSPEVSPGKSKKGNAPQFETDKRAAQRQQKRTSLPEGWMSPQEQPGSTEKSMEAEQKRSDDAASSPAEPLRKKTSSYMSPTKSAQHRNVATIGQESPRRMAPRLKARGLQINTSIAAKDTALSSRSPLRSGAITSSDEVFFSPRSHLSSNASSKRQSKSPKKTSALQDQLSPSLIESPSSAMRLPVPLREVRNVVVIRRDSDEDLLDPIKEKLDKEDLLKRSPTQEQRSTGARRGSRGEMLKPVFARLEKVQKSPELAHRSIFKKRRPEGSAPERKGSHVHSASTPSFPSGGMLHGSKDPSNEPISRLITGLRGQSSAEIGKALAGEQHESSDLPSSSLQQPRQMVDPAILYQGHKPVSDVNSPPHDPAILYQGRKPSSNTGSQGDPFMIFDTGYMRDDAEGPMMRPQPSSLRATASDFVPSFAPVFSPEPTFQDPEYQDDLHWQTGQVQSPFVDDFYQNQMSEPYSMAWPYVDHRPYATWHGANFPRGYDYSTLDQLQQQIAGSFQGFDANQMYADSTAKTPSISPTSSDTSAPWSKQSSANASSRWTITGKGRRVYLWTGSDGLEIGFKGHGPDAEHDPNTPVLYRNLRQRTKTLHLEAASFPRDHKPGSQAPPDAPKLMRQFAERMRLSKIPCDDFHWKGKYDVDIPGATLVAGTCSSCKESDNQLHRIGGGIEIAQY